MSAAFRRFEVLLPLQHNDGSPVAPELLAQTFDELRERFGAASAETQTIRGSWVHEGHEYRDELVRIWVDTSDDSKALRFFVNIRSDSNAAFTNWTFGLRLIPSP